MHASVALSSSVRARSATWWATDVSIVCRILLMTSMLMLVHIALLARECECTVDGISGGVDTGVPGCTRHPAFQSQDPIGSYICGILNSHVAQSHSGTLLHSRWDCISVSMCEQQHAVSGGDLSYLHLRSVATWLSSLAIVMSFQLRPTLT